MKRLIGILAMGIIPLLLSANAPERVWHSYPASHQYVSYVGRTYQSGDTVSFDYVGTYCRIRFVGNELRLRLHETGTDYLNIWFNGQSMGVNGGSQPDTVIRVGAGDTLVTIFRVGQNPGRRYQEHALTIQKRTEGEQGFLQFLSFDIMGSLQQAPSCKRLIEFVGDSYTTGYGTDHTSPTDHFSPATQNPNYTFAAMLAKGFDSDYMLVAHSGFGVCRNYNSKFPHTSMVKRYPYVFDEIPLEKNHFYLPDSLHSPDLTVILLGGNDFSVGIQPEYQDFRDAYFVLLDQIRQFYGPEHPVFCTTKPDKNIAEYVEQVVFDYLRMHPSEKHLICVPSHPGLWSDTQVDRGADNHPNYEGHYKLYLSLLPYLSTFMGWPYHLD